MPSQPVVAVALPGAAGADLHRHGATSCCRWPGRRRRSRRTAARGEAPGPRCRRRRCASLVLVLGIYVPPRRRRRAVARSRAAALGAASRSSRRWRSLSVLHRFTHAEADRAWPTFRVLEIDDFRRVVSTKSPKRARIAALFGQPARATTRCGSSPCWRSRRPARFAGRDDRRRATATRR